MKIKKVFKLCIAISIILVFLTNTVFVYAANSKTELNNKMGDINDQINDTKSEIKDVEKEMSARMKEIQKITDEISGYQREIDDLDEQLEELEEVIKEQEAELKKAEEDYEKQNEHLQTRLVTLYEAGQTSFIDVLLSSEDITDFISRYYLISEIADSDMKLLESIEEYKENIEIKKQSLEESKEKVEANKESKEKTAKALAESKSAKNKQVNELSSQEKELQKQLDEFEADKRKIQAELKRIAEEEARKNANKNVAVNPSAAGYIRPVNGYPITTGLYYSDGRYHGAVDYSGSGIAGKPVLAVKDGTVVTSTALRNSSGSYRSYGEYIVINHHDGTMTLYAHGAPGSRLVSANQNVKQGQQIMSVGTTGNSTGYHLHFEVLVNGKTVDPRPFLP